MMWPTLPVMLLQLLLPLSEYLLPPGRWLSVLQADA